MKLGCRLRWHNWSEWAETTYKHATFGFPLFVRECLDCGKKQVGFEVVDATDYMSHAYPTMIKKTITDEEYARLTSGAATPET